MKTLPIVTAWLGIVASVLFAGIIIWLYVTWQTSIGDLTQSAADSIVAIATATERTALTVESSQEVLEQTTKMVLATRNFIDAVKTAAESQSKIAPQYAEGLRSASTLGQTTSEALKLIGDAFQTLGIPRSVTMQGMRPVLVLWHPLGNIGSKFSAMAPALSEVSINWTVLSLRFRSICFFGQPQG